MGAVVEEVLQRRGIDARHRDPRQQTADPSNNKVNKIRDFSSGILKQF
jgi:hypothetical protein